MTSKEIRERYALAAEESLQEEGRDNLMVESVAQQAELNENLRELIRIKKERLTSGQRLNLERGR